MNKILESERETMNLLAATTLSTQRKGYAQAKEPLGLFVSKLQYICVIQKLDDDVYKLMIYHIISPEKDDKTLGKPCLAEKHHFEIQCSLEELKQFMEERGWSIDSGWMPLEDDTDVAV